MHHLLSLLCRLYCFLLAPSTAHYINGGPSLPPPLTPEQEKALLARMMAGDAAARDDLITHNLRLVVYLAKKYENSGVPQEDMISIGTIGLIKAVNTFTPARNIKLATYASRCIGNEILMYLRKSSNRRQEASIDEPLNTDGDGNELLLSDVLGSDENLVGLQLEQRRARHPPALRGAAGPPGAADHGAALRPCGRRGAHPEGSRRCPWHQPELHLPAGKADHPSAERGAGAGVAANNSHVSSLPSYPILPVST